MAADAIDADAGTALLQKLAAFGEKRLAVDG